ncbi:hypothetical protein [Lichenifustis flavocetrariae]|uniref:Uncharacterized protein n=1 Tax=Lichenifustis flavocetrariae TaxID=2949735 RepID=A0AA42CK75_9HYPH|nr:hypothetical protein [Lichenifustis flavocetrariae]MCW6510264.1 hypothetical protein [Lichenifustis flavocetrariae]
MQAHDDLDTVLQKIRELAETASNQAGVPPAVTTILSEIATLARVRFDDTPEPSDLPSTENQSL